MTGWRSQRDYVQRRTKQRICDVNHAAKQHNGLGCHPVEAPGRRRKQARAGRWLAAQDDAVASTEANVMEMSWLETVAFIGLDLQVGLILTLFVLDLFEHALHLPWSAFCRWMTVARRVQSGAPPRIAVGQVHRI
jgi:hypothetical protein